jgi:ATP-dependent DNA helicase RecG
MDNAEKDILSLIDKGIGPQLQWFLEDVSATTLAETMAGMANTNGGTILFGIDPETNKFRGLEDSEGVFDLIFEAALLTDPPLILPMPEEQQVSGARLLQLAIPAGLPQVYAVEGRFLGREGRFTSPMPPRTLRNKLIERGDLPFESQVPHWARLEDLDPVKIDAYFAALNLPKGEDPYQLLLRRGCLQAYGQELLPTYAGLLLFGKQPQRWLPNALVLSARFSGPTFSDEFVRQEITGTLPQQLRSAENFVRDHLKTVVRLVGLKRQETLEYPMEAVRELLVNAIAHRDYAIQGDSIHLHIFSNRLEVHSPGPLPGPVTLENLLEARYSRNPVIVQVLSDLGFIERMGYGLNRVVRVTREHNLEPPRFEEIAGSFRVSLGNRTKQTGPLASSRLPDLDRLPDLGLNSRQDAALRYIASNSRITNSDYQSLCPEVHPETLRRDLADLVRKGMIMKVGTKRGTYYILKETGEQR